MIEPCSENTALFVFDSYFGISTNTLLYYTSERMKTSSKERAFMRDRMISDKVIKRMETYELPITRRELDRAAQNISALAKRHGVPESEIRSGISESIHSFCGSQDSGAQALRKTCRFKGINPSPEEFLLWFRNLYVVAMDEHRNEGLTDNCLTYS